MRHITVHEPPTGIDAIIGRRIRYARELCGLSQADLGAVMEPPRSHAAVSDIERGKTRLTVGMLYQLAALLGQEVTWFLGEGDETPASPA